jgi:hypothetical protein
MHNFRHLSAPISTLQQMHIMPPPDAFTDLCGLGCGGQTRSKALHAQGKLPSLRTEPFDFLNGLNRARIVESDLKVPVSFPGPSGRFSAGPDAPGQDCIVSLEEIEHRPCGP